ncbi:MAG: hypothetical protein EPN23_11130 [Verrucomicrobia bacterium]|nr:MAG: hypothetical protein EPN23_11130 [Verrucomicrobiota bacterium]
MQYSYLDECLYKATLVLIISQGKLKNRIVVAYVNHLAILEPSWFPVHLQEQFADIKNKLTSNRSKTAKETIHFWKQSQINSIASGIFDLFCNLSYFLHSGGKK